jgi:hypothetical protein
VNDFAITFAFRANSSKKNELSWICNGENSVMSSVQRAAIAWNILNGAGIPGILDVYAPPITNGVNIRVEALRLRYGRLWVSRDDAIDLWWDVVETLRRTLKAGTLPGQLGNDPAAIEHVLDVEIPTMSRAQIEQMVDHYLAVFRLSRGHLGRHRRQHC